MLRGVLLALLLTPLCMAATISGIVYDYEFAPISGARILWGSSALATTANGHYTASLQSGSHTLVATATQGTIVYEDRKTITILPSQTSLALDFFLFPQTTETDETDIGDLFGEESDYPGFAAAQQGFSVRRSGRTLVVTTQDDAIYGQGYYSIGAQSWRAFSFGSVPSSGWLFGPASVSITLPAAPSTTENYLIIYSCSRSVQGSGAQSGAWDCHDGRWQITTFT